MQINNNQSTVFKRPKSLMCYICGREFGTKSLGIHIKTCEKMFVVEEEKKLKKDRRPLPQPPQGLLELLSKDEISFEDIERYNNRAYKKWEEESLFKCQFCNRTFNEKAFKNHPKYCSADRPFNPLPKQGEEEQQLKTTQQPQSNNNYSQVRQSAGNNIDNQQINNKQNSQFNEQIEEHKNVDLIQCQICERSFASDRIEKHQKICVKSSQKKKVKDDSNFLDTPQKTLKTQKDEMNKMVKSQVNLKSQNEKDEKSQKWKKQHEDLINNIKYNKKLKEVEEAGGDINQIEKPQSMMQDDRVQCPYCFRKFNQLAAERHIPVCQNTIHKPKPPPKSPRQSTTTQKINYQGGSGNKIKSNNQQPTDISKSVLVQPKSNQGTAQKQSTQQQQQSQQQNAQSGNSKQYNLYQPAKSYKFNY